MRPRGPSRSRLGPGGRRLSGELLARVSRGEPLGLQTLSVPALFRAVSELKAMVADPNGMFPRALAMHVLSEVRAELYGRGRR